MKPAPGHLLMIKIKREKSHKYLWVLFIIPQTSQTEDVYYDCVLVALRVLLCSKIDEYFLAKRAILLFVWSSQNRQKCR